MGKDEVLHLDSFQIRMPMFLLKRNTIPRGRALENIFTPATNSLYLSRRTKLMKMGTFKFIYQPMI